MNSAMGYTEGAEVPEDKTLTDNTLPWISVNDRLPDSCSDVLCLTRTLGNKYRQFVGNYTKGHELEFYEEDYDGEYDPIEDKNGTLYLKPGWYENEETPGGTYDEMWLKRDVTHWMPLPEPPK